MRSVGHTNKKTKGSVSMTEHIHPDTVRLLRECDSGVAMGVDALDNVLDRTHAKPLKQLLSDNKDKHLRLKHEIGTLLERYHDEGKQPPAMAKSMSHMKTGMKMAFDESDKTVADLITDGCNMGVKTLYRYLNEYKAADEKSKAVAKNLIDLEESLRADLASYL